MKLGQLLTELGYIAPNIAPDSVERELLFDMWTMLQGEENSGITVLNVKKTLLALQGICIDAVENPQALHNYGSQKSSLPGGNRPSTMLVHSFD